MTKIYSIIIKLSLLFSTFSFFSLLLTSPSLHLFLFSSLSPGFSYSLFFSLLSFSFLLPSLVLHSLFSFFFFFRLAKLKAIVGDHPAKEIEVKTSAGVMKFEGISRKFTRKLYEWEKARGIGPEASTFALLHPGYCPIDVKRIPKETHARKS